MGVNKICTLSSKIGKLINLEKLCLYSNKLCTLPSKICNLTKLKELFLHNNKLRVLPYEICKLKNLNQLSLNNNKLTFLPTGIRNFKNIMDIDESGYNFNYISVKMEIIIFTELNVPLENLPMTLKEIWIKGKFNKNCKEC